MTIILIIAGVILFFVILVWQNNVNMKKEEKQLKRKGLSMSTKIEAGTYVSGHPKIDFSFKNCFLFPKNGNIIIAYIESGHVDHRGEIKGAEIISVDVEDETSIEKKITLGRIALVGIFALAWKKKKKNEIAFVSVNWNDGRFEHSTVFCLEGYAAMNRANTLKNSIMRNVK